VITFTSFSEFNKAEGGDISLAIDERRPLACIAGIWTNWTPARKVKEGETTNDLFTFLTTGPNSEVGAIYTRATPVILTAPTEVETWMMASCDEPSSAKAASGRNAQVCCPGRQERRGRTIGDVSITEEEGDTVPSHRRRKIIQCLLRIGRAARQPGSPRQSGRRRRSRERVSWRRRSGESRLTATTSPQLLLELMAV
jgi:hypothetical protein